MTSATNQRKTTFVPVTSMEEVPVLSETERAEVLKSLKQAQTEIAAGDYVELKPGELEPWLNEQVKDARRRKHGA